MNTTADTLLSRKAVVLLLCATVLPIIALVLIQYLGLMSAAVMGAAGLIALAGALLVLTHPKIGVYFMLLYVYGGLGFYLPHIAPVGVVGVMAVGVLLALMRGASFRAMDGVFLCFVTLFALIALQSMLWAHNLDNSVFAFSILAKSVLLVVLIVQLIETPEDLRSFGTWIFLGGIAAVVLGMMNLSLGIAGEINVLRRGDVMRFTGTHANPNYAAAWMMAAIPMGFFYMKHGRNALVKLAGIAGVLILIAGVFSTLSRAAVISFAAVVLGVLVKEVKSPKIGAVMVLLLGVGLLLTPGYYWVRIMAVADLSQSVRSDWSFYLRYSAMRAAWDTFLEHPLTGVGLNNFRVRSASEVFVRIGPHNGYLEILADLGLFGFLTYMGVQYSALRQFAAGFRTRWQKGYEWLGDFSYYLILTMVSALVSVLFMDSEYNYLMWIPVAGGLSLANIRKRYSKSSAEPNETTNED
ncbi:MAG: O-antigen ligase family protein [Candidatus Krumholzibacteria bacterium]|nr:O-antigen ligase family protein [Candidatus Krumholzibacteria bacterium]